MNAARFAAWFLTSCETKQVRVRTLVGGAARLICGFTLHVLAWVTDVYRSHKNNKDAHPENIVDGSLCSQEQIQITVRLDNVIIESIPIDDSTIGKIGIISNRNNNTYFNEIAENIYWHLNPYILSVYYFNKNDHVTAQRLSNELIRIRHVDQAWAANLIGLIYSYYRDNRRALTYFNRAIYYHDRFGESGKKFDIAHLNRAAILYKLSRFGEAIAELRNVIKINSEIRPYAHFILGRLLARMGRPSAAIIEYQQAIGIDPEFAEPYNDLFSVFLHLGRFPEALAPAKRAVEFDISKASVLYQIAEKASRAGYFDTAREGAKEYLQISADGIHASNAKRLLHRM